MTGTDLTAGMYDVIYSKIGTYTYKCEALDQQGNSASATVGVRVLQGILVLSQVWQASCRAPNNHDPCKDEHKFKFHWH